MAVVVGIDLGTTNSAIAIMRKNKPVIVENLVGDRLTPSVVYIAESGEITVGEQARRGMPLYYGRTVEEIKRKMGSDEPVLLGARRYSPEEISAIILRYLIQSVEDRLGEKVFEAVITVPAQFNDKQRKATIAAGEIAGVKVERIINEPTAAALAYGLENFEAQEKILVYDLGGGTFDVTVLEVVEGIIDVKSSDGDRKLGGKDFDELITNHIIADYGRKHGIDLRTTMGAYHTIKLEAEKAKKDLSFVEATTINIPFLPGVSGKERAPGLQMRITRGELEALIGHLISGTEAIVDRALRAAKHSAGDIDKVLLVGGSTRIPMVRNLLMRKFGSKISMMDVNPDEAVALGAAVQAGIKSGTLRGEMAPIITDVCPYTLGTAIAVPTTDGFMGGVFDPLIAKNRTVPIAVKKSYYTLFDDQETVAVEVYQGEERLAERNELIGEFTVPVPKGPAGSQAIDIEFKYDINGQLEVNVDVLSTGERHVRLYTKVGLNKAEILKAQANISAHWERSRLANRVAGMIHNAERQLEKLDASSQKKVRTLLERLKEAVVKEDEQLLTKYEDELTELMFDIVV